MNLTIDDEYIESLVKKQVDERLKECRLQFASVTVDQLVQITGCSKTHLYTKVLCQPEMIEVRREIG